MVMRFAVKARSGSIHSVIGSNIVPAFPAGMPLESWSINGWWTPCAAGSISDGEDMMIGLDQVRVALAAGAPRKWIVT
jgi:hypothetical protein